MHITIDATALLLRSAGVKNHIYHWVNALRSQARADEEIRIFPVLDNFGKLTHAASTLPARSTAWRLAAVHLINLVGSPGYRRILPATDIFHASNLIHHAPPRARLTATMFDLTSRLMPQFHTRANIIADQRFADNILTRANGLIAISENTRVDAIRLLKISPDKIVTIYPGIADTYFDAPPERRPKPYVLFVGTIEPRKNLDTLLDAWRTVRSELRDRFDLVIAGMNGWGSQSTLARVRAETTYLGYVDESRMPALMAGATAVVYPSLYEGFGFPVAQAMAAGTPVLTSNSSCLPEIAGSAALLADPLSSAEFAAGLTRMLDSGDLRSQLSERGRRRAECFRSEICAARSLEFFRRVHGE